MNRSVLLAWLFLCTLACVVHGQDAGAAPPGAPSLGLPPSWADRPYAVGGVDLNEYIEFINRASDEAKRLQTTASPQAEAVPPEAANEERSLPDEDATLNEVDGPRPSEPELPRGNVPEAGNGEPVQPEVQPGEEGPSQPQEPPQENQGGDEVSGVVPEETLSEPEAEVVPEEQPDEDTDQRTGSEPESGRPEEPQDVLEEAPEEGPQEEPGDGETAPEVPEEPQDVPEEALEEGHQEESGDGETAPDQPEEHQNVPEEVPEERRQEESGDGETAPDQPEEPQNVPEEVPEERPQEESGDGEAAPDQPEEPEEVPVEVLDERRQGSSDGETAPDQPEEPQNVPEGVPEERAQEESGDGETVSDQPEVSQGIPVEVLDERSQGSSDGETAPEPQPEYQPETQPDDQTDSQEEPEAEPEETEHRVISPEVAPTQGSAVQPSTECPDDTQSCTGPYGTVCSSHGSCVCGSCVCESSFSGRYCQRCPTCPLPCQETSACVLCKAFSSGPLAGPRCYRECSLSVQTVDDVNGSGNTCSVLDASDCKVSYALDDYFELGVVTVKREKDCPSPVFRPNLLRRFVYKARKAGRNLWNFVTDTLG